MPAGEAKAIEIVESFGLLPLGIQRGAGVIADLFLFRDEHGSTVGVPLTDVCERIVWAKLLESRQRWEPGQSAPRGDMNQCEIGHEFRVKQGWAK
jgi:hypothetical protein